MFLLDTDTLSLLHAGQEKIGQRVRQVDPAEVATTIVTQIEILRARHAFLLKAETGEQLLRAQHWLHQSDALLSQIAIVSFDEKAASEFNALRQQKKLRKIGRADLLIASIVLARRDILVTRNLKHFQQIANLQLDNWAD